MKRTDDSVNKKKTHNKINTANSHNFFNIFFFFTHISDISLIKQVFIENICIIKQQRKQSHYE